MRVPWIDLNASYMSMRDEIDSAYSQVMNASNFILGSKVQEFEKSFAGYCGVKHCIGVGNGLDAMFLSLASLGIGEGDEVIVPANTYIATWLAVSRTGATPVPVEPEERSQNIDPALTERVISRKTKAIMMVDLYGRPAEAGELRKIADKHGIKLLEDAAQSHGATYHGKRTGSYADFGCFSFYPTKNLGAFGDGGAVTTNDDGAAKLIRELANYGAARKDVHAVKGFNSRLDELQAAFLSAKLPHLDSWNSMRRAIAGRYSSGLAGMEAEGRIVLPAEDDQISSCWHSYTIRSKKRNELQMALEKAGVGTLVHYPTPPHLQEAYLSLSYGRGAFPLSERLADEVLCLPMFPEMTHEQADYVIDQVKKAVMRL